MTRRADPIAVLLQSLDGGGAQRRVVDLVNGFVRCGRKVDLFLMKPNGELHDRLAPEVRLFPAESLPDYLRRTPPGAFLSGAAAVHRFAVQAVPAQRRFPLILRASSHPHRAIPWTLPRQRLLEQFRRTRRMRDYAAADLIIAVAVDVAEAIRQRFPEKSVEVIPNPVITEEFMIGAGARVDLPWTDGEEVPLILGIGRLAMAKDFPTLMRAFALLRARRPAHLAIIGDGSARERAQLLRLAKRLNIQSDFALPGNVDHVAAWLNRADLFVSASLWEGSPATLVEALAMGRPVVATDCVGIARQILADGTLGSLVPPRRSDLMAQAMNLELDRPHDVNRLRAAADPYRRDRSEDYLTAMDRCASRLAAG